MELPPFSWMRPVVTAHIHHPYQKQMSQRSEVFQLPIQMKNESKHEDCVDILDGYEELLIGLFNQAFGNYCYVNDKVTSFVQMLETHEVNFVTHAVISLLKFTTKFTGSFPIEKVLCFVIRKKNPKRAALKPIDN